MKYRNASDILPDDLLHEIQKYVQGQAIYIPSGSARKKWGSSGSRVFYEQRNAEIRFRFFHGTSIDELAGQYSLSPETIHKIIYK